MILYYNLKIELTFIYFIPNYISSHVQDGSAQAQSNLRFLNTLKEQCVDLSQAKPADIPDMLAPLLNKIRMIWVNSDHYKSRERLTGLFRKVSVCVIIRFIIERT